MQNDGLTADFQLKTSDLSELNTFRDSVEHSDYQPSNGQTVSQPSKVACTSPGMLSNRTLVKIKVPVTVRGGPMALLLAVMSTTAQAPPRISGSSQ